jgi:hypothetical protein
LYYALLCGITDLIFMVSGAILFGLAFWRIFNPRLFIVLILFLLWKGFLVGSVMWFFHKRHLDQGFSVKFIGAYLGRYSGFIIGGFLGAGIADLLGQSQTVGGIVGCVTLFLAGWWLGPNVSVYADRQLNKHFLIAQAQETVIIMGLVKQTILFIYGIIIPLLWVAIGFFFQYFRIPIESQYVKFLSIARIAAIVVSVYAIGSAWWLRKYLTMKSNFSSRFPGGIFLLGPAVTAMPAVYGLVLFLVMGASMIELCLFAAATSISMIIWVVVDTESTAKSPVP